MGSGGALRSAIRRERGQTRRVPRAPSRPSDLGASGLEIQQVARFAVQRLTELVERLAGVGEELLFRGFIPRGIAGFGAPLEAGLCVSVLVFALSHAYQGPIGVLATGVMGALLTAAYLLTGSLVFVIVIHVATDVIGLVLRPLTGMGLRRLLSVAP